MIQPEKKWSSNTCYNMEPLKHNSAWNKPDIKGQMIFYTLGFPGPQLNIYLIH